MRTVEQQQAAIAKKQRRKMRHKAKGQTIEGVINVLAASLIATPQRAVDVSKLYSTAQADIGKRLKLGQMNDAGARKARRNLNDWKLGKDQRPVAGYWNPEGKRTAR